MAQPTKVKAALESAAKAKIVGVTSAEAKVTLEARNGIANTAEATADLRSQCVFWRRELEVAIVRGDTVNQERCLRALAAVAASFT